MSEFEGSEPRVLSPEDKAKLVSLIRKRGNVKRQLTDSEKLLSSLSTEDLDSVDLGGRLQMHNTLWEKFDKIQEEIENLSDVSEQQIHDEERSSFENRFFRIRGSITKFMQKSSNLASRSETDPNSEHNNSRQEGSSASSAGGPSSDSNSDRNLNLIQTGSLISGPTTSSNTPVGEILCNNVATPHERANVQIPTTVSESNNDGNVNLWLSRFQLPKIQAPTFHGSYDTWMNFHDSFKSMCHDNPQIPTIQKFYYLKTCLRDEASDLIASLETTSENYNIAWELLKSRYDNKKVILESHIRSLFGIPAMSKEFTVRALLDNLQKRIRALMSLGEPVDHWDSILIFIVKERLNNYTRERWEEAVGNTVPSMKDMLAFLERRSLIESTQSHTKQTFTNKSIPQNKSNSKPDQQSRNLQSCAATTLTSQSIPSKPCFFCSQLHAVFSCPKFLELSARERFREIRDRSICLNCLKGKHRATDCRGSSCKKCNKRHNTLLHFDQSSSETSESTPLGSTTLMTSYNKSPIPSTVILGTAIVNVQDSKGFFHPARVLLDSCSQCNSITEKFANKLGLTKRKIDIQLHAVENLHTTINFTTRAMIRSRCSDTKLNIEFLVFKEISQGMPSVPLNKNSFAIPKNLPLADPEFHNPGEIDMLIGAEYFYDLLESGKIKITNSGTFLRETKFGWIIAGPYSGYIPRPLQKVTCKLLKFQDLPIMWELEPDSAQKIYSPEEQQCEAHFALNTTRDNFGRYTVKLPFNNKKDLLVNSRNTALQRFYSMERKFEKNTNFKKQYVTCMRDSIKQGHMSPAPPGEAETYGFYLPHHAVIKRESLTTKLRIVIDGSAKTPSGVSLNDALMVGPTIQNDLISIITRFRFFRYVLTADIQQMYRQIFVAPEDRSFQKIIWRENPTDPIKNYSLDTVTFGTACAPFLAIRTLFQLADDERQSFPIASMIAKRDFYVDDVLTGAQTFQDALNLRNDLIELLAKGGFPLRKWASNHPDLIKNFQNDSHGEFMSLDASKTVKTLGLHWDSKSDTLHQSIQSSHDSSNLFTKRNLLSELAKLFDPLGLLGPVVTIAKLLIQQLWKIQLSWDTPIPLEVQTLWKEFKAELPLLNDLNFPRFVSIPEPREIQIHGFCDASEKAYGACLYLRSVDKDGRSQCSLICSKSRVAPIKITSLPRLELCAAFLLTNLFNATIQAVPVKVDKSYCWSDSTIVLNQISTAPHMLKTFVANRVSEIQAVTRKEDWKHVPTADNPADFLSRGQAPRDFVKNELWKRGPQWLTRPSEDWPELNFQNPSESIPDLRQVRPIFTFKLTISGTNILTKFQNIHKLQRVMAYVLRYLHNIRQKIASNRRFGRLTPDEFIPAEKAIIHLVQAQSFIKEINALRSGKELPSNSSLLSLNPFLDEGILRVGGRLKNSELPETQKHPIVLPKNHHVTNAIIRREHIKRFHAGINATLYGVRERYWPIDGRNVTRHIIRNCVNCFRAKPPETGYLMGDLPKNRISVSRPFTNVGVDYCGPFHTKERRFRNRAKVKTYVAVFVCFATKAVHLELASDLTTEAFVACLKRFFARRGKASSITSDNATNFVGTANEIKDLYRQIHAIEVNKDIQDYLANERVTWHFIPPRAPHFGGLWEAGVKSFKRHFTRVAGTALLTFEQLHTYVVEIEGILNSRPLSPLSSDPNDLIPLTPAHFLIGSSMTSLPQVDLRDTNTNRLQCWQQIEQRRQHFWNRWSAEYLNELISRTKWQKGAPKESINIGTLVIVKEDNLPPLKWKMGRITEIHPGQDGIVRTVTIKTAAASYKRSLKSIYPLPVEN